MLTFHLNHVSFESPHEHVSFESLQFQVAVIVRLLNTNKTLLKLSHCGKKPWGSTKLENSSSFICENLSYIKSGSIFYNRSTVERDTCILFLQIIKIVSVIQICCSNIWQYLESYERVIDRYAKIKPGRFRSSPPEVFLGKGVLKMCCKFTGEHPLAWVFSYKFAP